METRANVYGDLLKNDLAPPGSFRTNSNEPDRTVCFTTRFETLNEIIKNADYRVLMRMARMGLHYDPFRQLIRCVRCDFTSRPIVEHMYNHDYSNCVGVLRIMANSANARFDSFRTWQHPNVSFRRIAESGFYYLGLNDTVCCPSCGLYLTNWFNRGDDPFREHARWSSSCPLLESLSRQKTVVALASAPPLLDEPVRSHPNALTRPNANGSSPAHVLDANGSSSADDEMLCKVCFERERNVCFVPCRHVCVCEDCAKRCQKCYVCRQKVTSLIRIFL
ncbi:iap2 [Leucania separata nucleopolyhedrovirus]|uniref:Iap2 n=1 Tax=Leucania separata nucleopolyhedrovirus TaxID=1307956 RepID=Q0IL39_NPVLS|nr:iap2 [Leucania separata nucleopolyhedrovirus]AAR28844.1 iap2 [Leucania separata nucleopolyhedrovirus]